MARLFRSGSEYAQIEVGKYRGCIMVNGDTEHVIIVRLYQVSNALSIKQTLQKKVPRLTPWEVVL